MRFFLWPRQTGKTNFQVNWLRFGPASQRRVLLVHSRAERARLEKDFPDLPPNSIATYDEWPASHRALSRVYVSIDNVEMFLQHHVGGTAQLDMVFGTDPFLDDYRRGVIL